MPRYTTVDDLVTQVRAQSDERNATTVTNADILAALNRAQDFATEIYARKYEDPFLVNEELTLVGGTSDYDLPEGAYSHRLEKVEISDQNILWEVTRRSFIDSTQHSVNGRTQRPDVYVVIGDQIRFYPTPSGAYNARIWYIAEPETLVASQGRVTSINTGSNYVLVEDIGQDLTTNADDLNSYVNIVNGRTGRVRGALQIQSISNSRITFKGTADRSTVYGTSVLGAIPSTVTEDDFLCQISGTCVPYFSKPATNFMIQYAVAEVRRRLGYNAELESRILENFEKQVERTWAGREVVPRIQNSSVHWRTPTRSYWGVSSK